MYKSNSYMSQILRCDCKNTFYNLRFTTQELKMITSTTYRDQSKNEATSLVTPLHVLLAANENKKFEISQ